MVHIPVIDWSQRFPGPATTTSSEELARVGAWRRDTSMLLFDVGVEGRVGEILLLAPAHKVAARLIVLGSPLGPGAWIAIAMHAAASHAIVALIEARASVLTSPVAADATLGITAVIIRVVSLVTVVAIVTGGKLLL